MGMSGGIDSSYLLYIMKEQYGLRPLVFHVDAGWNSQIAVNNIERLIDGLGLDLYTEVINWEEIKDLQSQLRQEQENYRTLKMAKMLEVTDGDMEVAKKRVTKLIRDVNKCITLLSEK